MLADLLAAIGELRLDDSNARHSEPDFVGLGKVRAAMNAVCYAGCHCDWRGVFLKGLPAPLAAA